MKIQILSALQQLEKQYNIRILLASETGSRSWGFPSPDSDYDVRFIYCHPLDWYLSIDEKKDTIEQLVGELDLVGWDLRKSLRLMRKSNAALFERLQSPIVYRQEPQFREELLVLAGEYFSCRAGLHHYLSMAFRYRQICEESSEVRLKDYFYLLRTCLASLWIVEKRSVPPMEFRELLPLIRDKALQATLLELVALKARVDERYVHPRNPQLDSYVKEIMGYCEGRAADVSKYEGSIAPLNQFFQKIASADGAAKTPEPI
ncbi:nucleotidyltransferase domain-containing protein [Cesiribacter andamanensis]|uniref:Putative nucleotidyltransferase n=1 Tax=Cesiribacter andamanensis AMV16 TaxID=1279009 RepID=M7N276_9BACT|nr:nucleotidyltransferase domain-containing protein [Cesiribacter andamanensis]EMR01306.1 putative nucleotidyltransferase [Cesiribacter andamanensis AMV16]